MGALQNINYQLKTVDVTPETFDEVLASLNAKPRQEALAQGGVLDQPIPSSRAHELPFEPEQENKITFGDQRKLVEMGLQTKLIYFEVALVPGEKLPVPG